MERENLPKKARDEEQLMLMSKEEEQVMTI